MTMDMPKNVDTAINLLQSAGFEAYAVGGCVRDSLLGKIPNDWDITTSAKPEDMKSVFADFHCIDTGIKHGTVTVVIDGESAITAKAPFNKEFTAAIYKNGEKYHAVVEWTATGGAELTVDGNTVRIYIGGTGTYTLTATCKGVSASVAITVNN